MIAAEEAEVDELEADDALEYDKESGKILTYRLSNTAADTEFNKLIGKEFAWKKYCDRHFMDKSTGDDTLLQEIRTAKLDSLDNVAKVKKKLKKLRDMLIDMRVPSDNKHWKWYQEYRKRVHQRKMQLKEDEDSSSSSSSSFSSFSSDEEAPPKLNNKKQYDLTPRPIVHK